MASKNKNFCRFDRDLDEKLIELVSRNEVIYNTGHKCYKDLAVRDDVWLAISGVVGRTVQDCKTRWRSLRDLYHRKKKDERRGKKMRSHWEYMDMLYFLEDFTTEKSKPHDGSSDEREEESPTITTQSNASPYVKLYAVPLNVNQLNDNELDSMKRNANDAVSVPPSKRVKGEERDENREEGGEAVLLLREIRDAALLKQHPVVTFFESMAKTVMGFPPALAAEAKLKVCQVVTELECRMLEESGAYAD